MRRVSFIRALPQCEVNDPSPRYQHDAQFSAKAIDHCNFSNSPDAACFSAKSLFSLLLSSSFSLCSRVKHRMNHKMKSEIFETYLHHE